MTGDLPPGWIRVRLDEIAEVRLGRQRSPKNHHGTQMRPYIRAANVGWDGLKLDDVKEMNFTNEEAAVYRLQPGDIVLSEASGSPSEVGKPAIWNDEIKDCCFQNTLIRVRSYGADPKFLAYYLKNEAIRGAFIEKSRGVGIHHLGAARLAEWPVPVPPLAEQHRIVAVLEGHLSRLDAGVESLASAVKRLERFRSIIFDQAISDRLVDFAGSSDGDYVSQIAAERGNLYPPNAVRGRPTPVSVRVDHNMDFPLGWPVLSLEEVTHPIRTISYGILKPGPNIPSGVPYVRVVNMRGDRISLGDLHRTSAEIDEQYSRSRLRSGDVLLSIRGTYGRVVLVPPELENANITQDTARLSFIRFVDPEFACIYLRSRRVQRYFRRIARGVAVKGINIGDLREMPFPVPPISAQRNIVGQVRELMSEYEKTVELTSLSQARSRHLRQSLLREAFAGRLIEQEPDDESASMLLERVRAERGDAQKTRRERKPKSAAVPVNGRTGRPTPEPVPNGTQSELELRL